MRYRVVYCILLYLFLVTYQRTSVELFPLWTHPRLRDGLLAGPAGKDKWNVDMQHVDMLVVRVIGAPHTGDYFCVLSAHTGQQHKHKHHNQIPLSIRT